MNPLAFVLALSLVASFACIEAQLAGWSPQQLQQLIQPGQQQQQVSPQQLQLTASPFDPAALGLQQTPNGGQEPQRQLTASDLQNQVQALGAQLAAANRQIQFYQQRLSAQPQQSAPVESAPLNQPLASQQQPQQLSHLQQQLQQQMQLQAALAAQQQQLALQQQQQQPSQVQPQQQAVFTPFGGQQMAVQQQQQLQQQQAAQFPSAAPQFQPAPQQLQQQQQQPQVSTLVDNSPSNPHSQFLASQQQQQQQQQFQQQLQQQQPQPTTSSSVEPASIEPSLAAQQPSTPPSGQMQAPARNDDKFSIGLGVLSPGYTQKFGNTELDFNQDKNGFSYTLSNNGHRNEPPPTPTTQKPAATASADS